MKITPYQALLSSYVTATAELSTAGVKAPTAPQIAGHRWKDLGESIPKVLVEEVRRLMPNIRKILHKQGYAVLPVSEEYYKLRRRPELTEAQVSRCLAIGRGKCETGILFVRPDDTLAKSIKVVHERWVYGTAEGKRKAASERIGLALDEGLLTQGEVLSITGEEAPLELESSYLDDYDDSVEDDEQ